MSNISWASGDSYERYLGRWSRIVAREFISRLGPPQHKIWLDIGCGTGALSQAILELAGPNLIEACDPSEHHILYARNALRDNRVRFSAGTVEGLNFSPQSFDVIVSGLVLNFMPNPEREVLRMKELVRSGGIVAAYVWDYAGKMEIIRYFWDAALSVDPSSGKSDEGTRFPLCSPEQLKKIFTSAGFPVAEVSPIDIQATFPSFEEYWEPFLGGQGPAPGYAMSLTEEKRSLLREHLRSHLPLAADGSMTLTVRAWAIKGMKP